MGAILFTYYHVDKWGNLVAVDLLPYIVAAVVSIVLICCVVSLVRRVLAIPFTTHTSSSGSMSPAGAT